MNEKQTKQSVKQDTDFVAEKVEATPSTLEIARAMGEGLAKVLASNPKIDTSGTASVVMQIEKKAREIGENQARFAQEVVANSKMINFAIPLIYKQFCPSMVISLNGCTIKLLADGKEKRIPERYAIEAITRLRYIDSKIQSMRDNGSNVQEIASIGH